MEGKGIIKMVILEMEKKKRLTKEKEEYQIKDIFAKDSKIDVNEIIKKSFLIELRIQE